MGKFEDAINELRTIFTEEDAMVARVGRTNDALFKAAATAKIKLEQALKRPETLNEAVYSAIDILREVTPYSNDYGKTAQTDKPLTDAEKILPIIQKLP